MRRIIVNLKYIAVIYLKEKGLCSLLILDALLRALLPFLYTLTPKILINAVQSSKNITFILSIVIIVCSAYLVIEGILAIIGNYIKTHQKILCDKLVCDIADKATCIDFAKLEGTSVQNDIQTMKSIVEDGSFQAIMTKILAALSNMISLVGLMIILFFLEWYIVMLIFFFVIINSIASARAQNADYDFMIKTRTINRKVNYTASLLSNYVSGKEIRSYQLSDYIINKYNSLRGQFYKMRRSLTLPYLSKSGASAFSSFLQRVVVFSSLIKKYAAGKFTIGNFSSILVATEQCSAIMTNIISTFNDIKIQTRNIEIFRSIINMPDGKGSGTVKCPDGIDYIEFRNVEFRYPGQNGYAIKNISLKIYPRRKYAIVGRNGAGKTTLIKLLLRLYSPTHGKILINGIDIETIDIDEYRKLFATVFQDFALFSLSIKDNIKLSNDSDNANLDFALNQTGLDKIIEKLPNGIDTYLNRDYEEHGVSMSIGEQQKLAITRALYKNAPVMILDEPTASLSPLAEEELYKTIENITQEKMVIFISHRLASTLFCDEILLLDNGEIIERGSHIELMDLRGQYSRLFYLQMEQYKTTSTSTISELTTIDDKSENSLREVSYAKSNE